MWKLQKKQNQAFHIHLQFKSEGFSEPFKDFVSILKKCPANEIEIFEETPGNVMRHTILGVIEIPSHQKVNDLDFHGKIFSTFLGPISTTPKKKQDAIITSTPG